MPSWTTDIIPGTPRLAIDHAGAGPLVIFLHGIGGNRTNWHDQIPAFSDRFHAVSWDARGYGESDDYDGPLDFGDFAVDLIRVLDRFDAPRAHLVGLSMGGVIALDFAARYPDRLATLTLCDTMPGFGHLTEAQRREFIRLAPGTAARRQGAARYCAGRRAHAARQVAAPRMFRAAGRQHDGPA